MGWLGLAIHEHEIVGRADLVRMRARGNLEGGELLGRRGIAHIDERRAVRGLHVRDVGDLAVDDDLAAPRAIEISHLLQSVRAGHTGHDSSPFKSGGSDRRSSPDTPPPVSRGGLARPSQRERSPLLPPHPPTGLPRVLGSTESGGAIAAPPPTPPHRSPAGAWLD